MEFANAIWFLFRVSILCGMCAAATTFAVIAICRWQKWAPINITVNVIQNEATLPAFSTDEER